MKCQEPSNAVIDVLSAGALTGSVLEEPESALKVLLRRWPGSAVSDRWRDDGERSAMDQRQHLIKETQTAGDKTGNNEGERQKTQEERTSMWKWILRLLCLYTDRNPVSLSIYLQTDVLPETNPKVYLKLTLTNQPRMLIIWKTLWEWTDCANQY